MQSNEHKAKYEESKQQKPSSVLSKPIPQQAVCQRRIRNPHETNVQQMLYKTAREWDKYVNFAENELVTRVKWLSEPNDRLMRMLCQDVIKRIKLHNWKYIKQFKLDFQKSQIHEILETIFKTVGYRVLKDLRHLKILRLTFTRWADHLDFLHFNLLVQQIVPFLRGLSSLTFDFFECHRINDPCLSILMMELGSYCRGLKKLALHFSKSNFITDVGVKRVGKSIGRYFPRLQELTLKFQGCRAINNQGLESMMTHLGKKMRDLVDLTLDFSRCEAITSVGLEALGNVLAQKFTKLRFLRLEFQGCQGIETEGLSLLLGYITVHLKNLKILRLYFNDCELLKSGIFAHLEGNISENLKSLKTLSLDLSGCPDIKSKEKIILQKKLNGINGLEAGVF